MTKTKKKELIEQYVAGWRQNDESLILKPLADDCLIIESHGPTYHGKLEVRNWFRAWLKENGLVRQWQIVSVFQTDQSDTCIFEWYFECFASGKEYQIPGISVVKFSQQKICFIHEYRMTKLAFDWGGKKLDE